MTWPLSEEMREALRESAVQAAGEAGIKANKNVRGRPQDGVRARFGCEVCGEPAITSVQLYPRDRRTWYCERHDPRVAVPLRRRVTK